MPGPVVETSDRLALRTVERDDAAFLQRAYTDPRVRYSLGTPHHVDEAERAAQIERDSESDGTLSFVVCLRDGERAGGDGAEGDVHPRKLGAVHARNLDGDCGWLAYWLLPEFRGEGYGGEAVELLVDTVFQRVDVHSVNATAFAFNEASRGVLESLGFREEIREREVVYVDGAYRDACNYEMLRREWTER
jgi:ribosomal-protein-alanine N-acetyltransferase